MKIEDLYDATDYVAPEYMANIRLFYPKAQKFESIYIAEGGEPLILTNAFRTRRRHVEIYAKINKARIAEKKNPLPVPMGSKHLLGWALDAYDPEPMKKLRIWMKARKKDILEECDIWAEQFDEYPRIHIQGVQFASWKPGASRYFRAF